MVMQVLASGGADCVVKLWDVSKRECSLTATHHSDKVVALQWHPTEVRIDRLDHKVYIEDLVIVCGVRGTPWLHDVLG